MHFFTRQISGLRKTYNFFSLYKIILLEFVWIASKIAIGLRKCCTVNYMSTLILYYRLWRFFCHWSRHGPGDVTETGGKRCLYGRFTGKKLVVSACSLRTDVVIPYTSYLFFVFNAIHWYMIWTGSSVTPWYCRITQDKSKTHAWDADRSTSTSQLVKEREPKLAFCLELIQVSSGVEYSTQAVMRQLKVKKNWCVFLFSRTNWFNDLDIGKYSILYPTLFPSLFFWC